MDLPGGPLMGGEKRKATPLSRTLEGLFELTLCPSRALDSPRALLLEQQRDRDTARCLRTSSGLSKVPGHHQEKRTQTLIVHLFKTHLFSLVLDFEKSTEYN